MEGTTEEPTGSAATAIVDQTYEFLAPRWFDFVNGETEDEARRAELWFASALSCAPSREHLRLIARSLASVPTIKARRCFKVETMCNFNEEEEEDKRIKDKEEPSEPVAATIASQPESDIISEAKKEEVDTTEASTIKPTHSRSKDAADASAATAIVDQTYEFLAPRWFDFVNGETEDEARRAELWFASALSCAPSREHLRLIARSLASVPTIKARRCFKVETMCNFNEEEEEDKRIKDKEEPSEPVAATIASQPESDIISEAKKEEVDTTEASTIKPTHSRSKDAADASNTREKTPKQIENKENIPPSRTEACTPTPPLQSSHGGKSMDLKKQQTARKIASLSRNPSALRPKNQPHSSSQLKGTNQKSVKRETSPKNIAGTTSLIQDNQAIKKQKLDDGKSRQILNPKPTTLLHKTRQGLVNTGFNVCPSVTKQTPKENRKGMEGTTEEPIGSAATAIVDQSYEFLAPRWFDFVNGETEDEARRAELWFASALSCAPSPSVPRIKARRCFKVETMCNFNEEEEEEDKRIKDKEPSEPVAATIASQPESDIISEAKKEEVDTTEASTIKPSHSRSKDAADASNTREKTPKQIENKENIPPSRTEACTPKPPLQSSHGGKSMDIKKQQTARKIASLLRNPSALRPKNQPHSSSQLKGTNQKSVKRETSPKNIAGTTSLIQDNQAIKKQKLDDGKSRQILNPKPTTLLHKTRQGLVNTGFNVCPSVTKQTPKENRKVRSASWMLIKFF
ncbi:hypothetical protein F2Q68_00012807 [Brassica cretica]|uniref:TPX2 central domain-containing protein n=1 Tax=Brassica cretica TaxID=69181 RepID=A0A8S9H971_BRACR|nr:hypothetical protein F2Q68_00012807 [Brassica cretica]